MSEATADVSYPVEVKPSTIEGAGRGVFATRGIQMKIHMTEFKMKTIRMIPNGLSLMTNTIQNLNQNMIMMM